MGLLGAGSPGLGSVASQLLSCLLLCRAPVVKHYKVKREGTKYVIDVEDPVSFGGPWALGFFPHFPA